MRFLCMVLCLCAISWLSAATVIAQNGAEVDKGTYDDCAIVAFNEDEGLLYALSCFSDICGYPDDPGETSEIHWIQVNRPNDWPNDPDNGFFDGKYQDRGFFFTRVLNTTPEEFFATDDSPCEIYYDTDLIVADGIIHSTFNDNDQFPADTNRANVWGFTASGALEDFGDVCPGEAVAMKWNWRVRLKDDFPACIPFCDVRILVDVGPQINCH